MLRLLLIQPGSTDFDDQGRMKGALDLPLNTTGSSQVARTAGEVSHLDIQVIYYGPSASARQTAEVLAARKRVKTRELDRLRNLDHGLWHGKLIEEVRQTLPKVYRQGQDRAENVRPPGGETIAEATARIKSVLGKLIRKHKNGIVAIVVPEPLLSLVQCCVEDRELHDLWNAEFDRGHWQLIDVQPEIIAS